MRIFRNCEEYIREMDRELFQSGIKVAVNHYQNKKLEGDDRFTKEIIGVNVCISKPLEKRKEMLEFIFNEQADRIEQYCIQEFKDRISPIPLNPGESYKIRQDMWQKFLVDDNTKFDYCVTGDSQVITPKGLVYITDLKEGDVVFDKDGHEVVIRKFVHLKDRDIKRIKCWRGFEIIGTYNHPVMTYNPITKIKDWKILSEITEEDYIQIFNKYSEKPLDISPIEAKLFGMIYSDGHIYTKRNNIISFVNKSEDVINTYCKIADELNIEYHKGFNHCNESWQIRFRSTSKENKTTCQTIANRMYSFLENLPYASTPQIISFLQGFLLGDGNYNHHTRNITFCTNHTHPEQISNIRIALLKLGIIGFTSKFKTKYGNSLYVKVSGGEAYHLNDLLEKPYQVKPIKNKGYRRGILEIDSDIFVKVKNIEDRPKEDVFDISTNGSFICNYLVSHNTYSTRLCAKWQAIIDCLKEDKHSRQAVMQVFEPQDTYAFGGDTRIPCSLHYQFLIRNNQLHCIYCMRSNDYFGHNPIDIWLAAETIKHLTEQLKETYPELETGKLYYQAGSLHAYNWDLKARLLF